VIIMTRNNNDDWSTAQDLPDHLKTPDQRDRETTAATPKGPFEEGSADRDQSEHSDDVDEHIPLEGHKEFLERQRLEDILRAQRDAREAVATAPAREAEMNGDRARMLVDKFVAGEVKRFISVIQEPLRQTTAGKQYWGRDKLGEFRFDSADVLRWKDVELTGVPDHMFGRGWGPGQYHRDFCGRAHGVRGDTAKSPD